MQLRGAELAEILKAQDSLVEVRNAQSFPVGNISPAAALRLVESGRFIGVGNRRRVQFIRPELQTVVVGWKGSSRTSTQRIRNDKGEIIAPGFILEHKPLVYARAQG